MLDDSKVVRLGNRQVAVVGMLDHLSLNHLGTRPLQIEVHFLVVQAQAVGHGRGIKVIPDQNARVVSPQRSHRFFPPPKVPFIDHVVVKQRGGVNEFHDGRQQNMVFAR